MDAADDFLHMAEKEYGLALIGANGRVNELAIAFCQTALNAELTYHMLNVKMDWAGPKSGGFRNGSL